MGRQRKVVAPKRPYRSFSDETKREVIKAYVNEDKSIYTLGKEYGISPHTIYLWLTKADLKQYKANSPEKAHIFLSGEKGGKVVAMRECSNVGEALYYKAAWEIKGYKVEARKME